MLPIIYKGDGTVQSVKDKIAQVLIELGAPRSNPGFRLMQAAVQMALEDQDALCAIVRHIYLPLSEQYGLTMSVVERGLRIICGAVWERGGRQTFERITGRTFWRTPTNSEFIECLSSYIRDLFGPAIAG